jgi:type I restriction enzyme S subunit
MSLGKNDKFKYPVFSSQTKNKGLTGFYTEYLFEDCITWTTDGANAGDVNLRKDKFYCTNVCGVLISDKGYVNQCIAEILNSVTKRYVSYVGNPKLMNNTMGSIIIKIPKSIKEQSKISTVFSSIDTKIEQVGKQLNSTKEFKKALLQQMFV